MTTPQTCLSWWQSSAFSPIVNTIPLRSHLVQANFTACKQVHKSASLKCSMILLSAVKRFIFLAKQFTTNSFELCYKSQHYIGEIRKT